MATCCADCESHCVRRPLAAEPKGMTYHPSSLTWLVLQDFGFDVDQSVISDEYPGLSYNFGNFKLSASCFLNQRCVKVVHFAAVLVSSRCLADVQFELPLRVESPEQCAAWIAWHFDQYINDAELRSACAAGWLDMGRRHFHLLLWEREQALYRARPQCEVQRDWLRLALKSLEEIVSKENDEAKVIFGFDGKVLTIWCAERVVALPADGIVWLSRYAISAGSLRHLPKRIMGENVGISVWEDRLNIGRNSYGGVQAERIFCSQQESLDFPDTVASESGP